MAKLFYRVCGIKRSGNHAIINWLASQYSMKRVKFVNDVQLHKNISLESLEFREGKNKLPCLNTNRMITNPDVVIFSHEDKQLPEIKKHIIFDQDSPMVINVIILRDVLNNFAGMFKFVPKMTHIRDTNMYDKSILNKKLFLWKQYALEFMGLTSSFYNRTIMINYNLWCVNKFYRQIISGCLPGTRFDDSTITQIPQYGYGSSFDDQEDLENSLRENPDHSIVFLERYKQCLDIPEFRSIVDNKQVMEINNLIFGINYDVHLL